MNKGKGVLFEHVIICVKEMNKSEIDQALRIYKTLGIVLTKCLNGLEKIQD